jgi:hypothetical protein
MFCVSRKDGHQINIEYGRRKECRMRRYRELLKVFSSLSSIYLFISFLKLQNVYGIL